jgi:hypothetical protein
MHNLIQNYGFILNEFKKLSIEDNFYYKPIMPKMSDLQLVALNLTAEYCGIDSERQLFRLIGGTEIGSLVERSVYNKRKRRLFPFIDRVRQLLARHFNEHEDCFIVDSMPLEICKNARAARSTICREQENAAPDRGFCPSQNMRFYGFKLHAVCSVTGVFHSFDLTPASVHDIHYLKDIQAQMTDCVVVGDKGYLSSKIQLNLFETVNIRLETPPRANQKSARAQPYVFKKSRKRIETLFSQLCDQFMIRRNYAKTLEGFKTRIMSKITALTTVQYINRFVFNRNINNIKIAFQ